MLFPQLAALAFAASIGLTDFAHRLGFLLPICGFTFFCVTVVLKHSDRPSGADWIAVTTTLVILLNPIWSIWLAPSTWYAALLATLPLSFIAGRTLPAHSSYWVYADRLVLFISIFFALWVGLEFIASNGTRSNGPLLDQNAAGAVIYLSLIPLLGKHITTDALFTRTQAIRLLAIAVLGFGLFATASRGAIGVFIISTALLFTAVAIKAKDHPRRLALIAASAIVMAASFTAATSQSDAITSRNYTNLEQDKSTQARLLIWKSTFEMYLDNPWLGSGLGTFALAYPSVRDPAEAGATGDLAHNDYLQVLAEGGPLLLLPLLLLGLWITSTFLKLLFRHGFPDLPSERWNAVALSLAIGAALVHAGVNFIIYVPSAVILIALQVARLRSITSSQIQGRGSSKVCPPILGKLVLIFILSGFFTLIANTYSAKAFYSSSLKPADYKTEGRRYWNALAISYLAPTDYFSLLYLIQAQTQAALNWGATPAGAVWAESALQDIKRLKKRKKHDCVSAESEALLLHLYTPFLDNNTKSSHLKPLKILDKATDSNPLCRRLYALAGKIALETEQLEYGIAISEKQMRWFNVKIKDRNAALDSMEVLAELHLNSNNPRRAYQLAKIIHQNAPERSKAERIIALALSRLELEAQEAKPHIPTSKASQSGEQRD